MNDDNSDDDDEDDDPVEVDDNDEEPSDIRQVPVCAVGVDGVVFCIVVCRDGVVGAC